MQKTCHMHHEGCCTSTIYTTLVLCIINCDVITTLSVWLPWHVPRLHIAWVSSHRWARIFSVFRSFNLVKIVTPCSISFSFLAGPWWNSEIETSIRYINCLSKLSALITLYGCNNAIVAPFCFYSTLLVTPYN